MSAVAGLPAVAPREDVRLEAPSGIPKPATSRRPDVIAAALVALLFAVLTAATWRRWGVPEIDAGAELSTAAAVAHGATPYDDVRYFYGPAGLYALVAAFKVFGVSFTTAFAFGLAQTAAITAVFYVLGRQWLRPLYAALASAMLLGVAFSGTAFDFVLPHTNSATIGLLFILLTLLALARDRPLAAGVAAGIGCLTRPEYVAVVAALLGTWLLASWRTRGLRAALRDGALIAVPALAIPIAVLAAFAARVGASHLFWDNLWPREFLRFSGLKTQSDWMPLTPAALAGAVMRGVAYLSLLGAVAGAAVLVSGHTGARRLRGLWPLVLVPGLLLAADLLLRALSILGGQRAAIELEARHLMLGMSWLPALGFLAVAWVLFSALRHRSAPFGRNWPVDAALAVAAGALGLRAYNAFTTEGSYAPYYAAPLILVAGILHQRLGDVVPRARTVSAAALGLVAAGLIAYALAGLYADDSTTVHTARGAYATTAPAALAVQPALDRIRALTRPGEPILAAPVDGGIPFMADRPAALPEQMLLPGLLATAAEERKAIATLDRRGVRVALVADRDFSAWGFPRFGRDYDPLLGAELARWNTVLERYGPTGDPVGGTTPSQGFTLRARR